MKSKDRSPESYELNSVLIEVFRGSEEPVIYDLTNMVAEVDIYESIQIPYLTATILIVDSSAMSSLINYNGTEVVKVTITPIAGIPIELTFNVYSVSGLSKGETSDFVSTYSLNLIESHGLLSSFKRVRKAFSGNAADIVSQIFKEVLSVETDPARFEKSQQSFKVVIPNLTPLGAIDWIRKRATTEYGEPFYVYSTIRGGLAMRSVGSLLSANPMDEVYRYSSAPPPLDQNERFAYLATQIQRMQVSSTDDLIKMAKSGAIASRFFSIDPFTKSVNFIDFSQVDNFAIRRDLGRTLHQNLPIDLSFKLPDGSPVDVDSAYFSQITTTQMHESIAAYDEETDPKLHVNKVAARSTEAFLKNQEMDIVIPGHNMFNSNNEKSVGRVINIEVPKDQPSHKDTDRDAIVDKRRSGRWLIARARHKFTADGICRSALTLWRPATEDPLNGKEIRPDYR